jgi:hypothetical protein
MAPMPMKNERARVAALQKYARTDTEPEPAFDDLVLLASFICKTPIALISLVDERRGGPPPRIAIPPRPLRGCRLPCR